jgi:hypothetical protein
VSSRVFRPLRAKARVSASRFGAPRLAITLFALLAFTLQSYVTQIHIHGASWGTAATLDAGKAHQPGKLPAGDDQNSCPICQVIAHSGQFITPSAVAVILPALVAFYVVIDKDTSSAARNISHSWNSRAPPRI